MPSKRIVFFNENQSKDKLPLKNSQITDNSGKEQKKCRCRSKCYRKFKCYKTKSDNATSPNTNKKGCYAKINDELVRAKKCM